MTKKVKPNVESVLATTLGAAPERAKHVRAKKKGGAMQNWAEAFS
jgi:hypothetical protein